MQANKSRTNSAKFLNEHVIYNSLHIPDSRMSFDKYAPDYHCRSHATSFARCGIATGGKHYSRDIVTGTWFKHVPDRERELHHSPGEVAYRYTESKAEKGKQGKTYTIWSSSPPGFFWREPCIHAAPEKSTPFGHTHGHQAFTTPLDPKDMPDALSPLTRTVSAPNFHPMLNDSRKSLSASQGLQRPASATMMRSGKNTLDASSKSGGSRRPNSSSAIVRPSKGLLA